MGTLSPRAEALIAEQVASGKFADADAFVDAALSLVEWSEARKAQELAWLEEKLARGMAELARGEFVDGPAFFAELEAEMQPHREAAE